MNDGDNLDRAFSVQKQKAEQFIDRHNAALPTEKCPGCAAADHCPGLPCPDCGFVNPVSWAILRDDEWGYVATALNDRKLVLARFYVDEPA